MFRIMVVDDERMVVESIKGKINWTGHDAVFAGHAFNGAEALEKFEQCKPDIMLVDMKMPVMDGIQLIKRVKQLDYICGIIILSAYADFFYAREAMKNQVDEYLLKPVKSDELNSALENAIAHVIKARRDKELIAGSLKNAVNAMRSRNLLAGPTICDLEEAEQSNAAEKSMLDNEEKARLRVLLKRGRREEILGFFKDVFQRAEKSGYLSESNLFELADALYEALENDCRFYKGMNPKMNFDDSVRNMAVKLAEGGPNIDTYRLFQDNFGTFIDEIIYGNIEGSRKCIYEIKAYIDGHYSENIKLKDICRKYLFSEEYFSRLFKDELKIGFAKYMAGVRMQHAKELLKVKSLTLKDIGELTGYTDTKYFMRTFKAYFKETPGEKRKQL